MNNATEEKKNRKGNSELLRPGLWLALTIAGAVFASGITLVPGGEAQGETDTEWSVNNMHCGHGLGGSWHASKSGPPHHDNVKPVTNLRGDCQWGGQNTGESYSVATPLQKPALHAELYLKAPSGGGSIEGKVCLRHATSASQNPSWTDWTCGDEESTTSTLDPEWWWDSHEIGMQSAPIPNFRQFQVGVQDDADDFRDISLKGTIRTFNGNTVTTAEIDDTQGDNSHLNFTDFKSWTIHDPEGDDKITIGGTTTRWDPGSALDLVTHDTRIEYHESPAGGNEWTISSISGSDTVYVWTASGEWNVVELVY